MEITKVFVDLDGVLADFERAAFKLHGIPAKPFPTEAGWDIIHACNILDPTRKMTANKFWGAFDYKFWATLPTTDICDVLIEELRSVFNKEQLCILTAANSAQAAAGKVTWIKTNLPNFFWTQYLIGSAKQFCAGPQALLIDDRDLNVEEFRKHGGHAILVPRPWNTLHAEPCWPHIFKEIYGLFSA